MKVVVLAGGLGSRLLEETRYRPKALVPIGGRPILWHILNHYAHFGFKDFLVALGHGGRDIKAFFAEELHLQGDLRLDFSRSTVERTITSALDWKLELVDTGKDTPTGGRLMKLKDRLKQPFFLTWSDGVSDLDIGELLRFHRSHGKLATVTAVRPPSRFGLLDLEGDSVSDFQEKPSESDQWINGAFFVLEPGALDYIENLDLSWEEGPMVNLARDGELKAYRHTGFWQCMDTLKEKRLLETLWAQSDCPWRFN